MEEIENPFQSMLDSRNPERFFGSDEAVRWVVETISGDWPRSFPLLGLRGMGKTSLLAYFADPDRARSRLPDPQTNRRVFPVLVEYRGRVRGEDPFVYLARRFAQQCGKNAADFNLPPLAVRRDYQGVDAADQAIKDIRESLEALNQEHGIRPLLLLDDFHLTFEEIEESRLINMLSWQGDASVITTTEQSFRTLPNAGSSVWFGDANLRYMPALTFNEAWNLIAQTDRDKRLPEKDIMYLLGLVGARRELPKDLLVMFEKTSPVQGVDCFHPHLVLGGARTLWGLRKSLGLLHRKDERLPAQFRRQFSAMLFDAFRENFRRYWHLLTEEEQELLILVARRPQAKAPDDEDPVLRKLQFKRLVVVSSRLKGWMPFCTLFQAYLRQEDQTPATLTEQEQSLLEYLRRHAGRICSVDELHREIWKGPEDGEENVRNRVQSAISRLRDKLPRETERQIVSYRSRGYCYGPLQPDKDEPGR